MLGTGCNAAFVEKLEKIERWTGDTDPKHVSLEYVNRISCQEQHTYLITVTSLWDKLRYIPL